MRQHRTSHRRHQRVAVVGSALFAGREAADLLSRQQGGQRDASAKALAQRHDVGLDPRMLIREELAGPAHSGLHFIEDQQDPGIDA